MSGRCKRIYAKEPIYKDFVVIDFETTGLSPYQDRIIEIGAIKVRNNKIADTYNTLIDPGIAIPYHIQRLTGITNEMVLGAPYIEQVKRSFVEFLADLPVLAHNVPFDAGFLDANFPDNDPPLYIDTVKLARKFFAHLPNYRLGTICWHLDISTRGSHRAMADCHAAHQVYYRCKEVHYRGATG